MEDEDAELAHAIAAIEAAEAAAMGNSRNAHEKAEELAGAMQGPALAGEDEEGVLCPICHSNIQPQEAALIRGCDHAFCNGCILNWALQKPKCQVRAAACA